MPVNVGKAADMAVVVDAQGEIGQVNRQAGLQSDGFFAFADHGFQSGLVQTHAAQQGIGKGERLVDPHTAMAESPFLARKQIALRGVVQIDGMFVGEHEFDEAQRVALARRLADADDPVIPADHLIAVAFGIIGIGGDFGQKFFFQDGIGHAP